LPGPSVGLVRPTALASDGHGRVFVADPGAGEIIVLGPPGPAGTGLERVGVVRHSALGVGIEVTALETTPAVGRCTLIR